MKKGEIIRTWYKKNRRDLPWRETTDPYRIWISEVILQQTRVSQGLEYYRRFIEACPDIASLAAAEEDRVLKLWQGLGYYSRARNLLAAARQVMDTMDGEIPRTYEGLMKMKGVGTYTASAIASICFNEARAVVDGNVSRVISRLYGVRKPVNTPAGRKIISGFAAGLLDPRDPGTHNQAMMEFGALQCLPLSPGCEGCPLKNECQAYLTGSVGILPVKSPRRKPLHRWIYYFILRFDSEVILTKRGTTGIWRSLYQFPSMESMEELEEDEIIRMMEEKLLPGLNPSCKILEKISGTVQHQLTHRTIHARFIHVSLDRWPEPQPQGWIRTPLDRLDDFPIPRLIHRYLEVVKI